MRAICLWGHARARNGWVEARMCEQYACGGTRGRGIGWWGDTRARNGWVEARMCEQYACGGSSSSDSCPPARDGGGGGALCLHSRHTPTPARQAPNPAHDALTVRHLRRCVSLTRSSPSHKLSSSTRHPPPHPLYPHLPCSSRISGFQPLPHPHHYPPPRFQADSPSAPPPPPHPHPPLSLQPTNPTPHRALSTRQRLM